MKKLVLYPFLFDVYLILNLVVANLNQLDPALAWLPLLALLAGTLIGMLLFTLILKDWHYAGYLVFIILVFIFSFGHLSRVVLSWISQYRDFVRLTLLAIWWLLLGLLGLRKVWNKFGAAQHVTSFLNGVFFLALIIQSVVGLNNWLRDSLLRSKWVESPTPWQLDKTQNSINCENSPDIYYIIVDGYARQDVLQDLYKVDNESFLTALEERGFYIAEQSHSNYTQTVFSLSSSLNMNYLGEMPEGMTPQKYFSALIANNRVLELLRQCNYQTVAIETGFFYTNRLPVDTFLAQNPRLNEFTAMLFSGSPIDVLAQELYTSGGVPIGYQSHRNWITFNFESLTEIPTMSNPKFVFAHILAPHPPFVFSATGDPVEPNRDYQILDGSAFAGDWEEYRMGYTEQVQFVNTELLKSIDAILTKSSTAPIIIIQGDHGPGSFLNWRDVNSTCLWERTSILNAYYLPGNGSELLYPEITPVNSFRFILDNYFSADLDLLPDQILYSSFIHDPPIIDVTGKQNSKANCLPAQ